MIMMMMMTPTSRIKKNLTVNGPFKSDFMQYLSLRGFTKFISCVFNSYSILVGFCRRHHHFTRRRGYWAILSIKEMFFPKHTKWPISIYDPLLGLSFWGVPYDDDDDDDDRIVWHTNFLQGQTDRPKFELRFNIHSTRKARAKNSYNNEE